MRRQRRDGEFRNMCVLRREPLHAAQPEACAQPIDQMRQLSVLRRCSETGLRRIAALGNEGRQPHHIETETGIAGIAQHSEAIGK